MKKISGHCPWQWGLILLPGVDLLTAQQVIGMIRQPDGYHATALSTSLVDPVEDVPALRHYRLIHESPTNMFDKTTPDLKYVKIFEYVKEGHIRGTGIRELDLVSTTGRNFTCRQESISGEFVVPFAMSGNSHGVTATGKYRIYGSDQEFDVPESAVMLGSSIN